jgi:hypothetical protein
MNTQTHPSRSSWPPRVRWLAQAQTVISSGHVDIGIAYESGNWDLHVHQEQPVEAEYEPDEVILQVGPPPKPVSRPTRAFSFLGNPGDPIWMLPKSENPELLFLGIGAEELDPADWTGNITLSLGRGRSRPSLRSGTPICSAAPLLKMNSGDGIDAWTTSRSSRAATPTSSTASARRAITALPSRPGDFRGPGHRQRPGHLSVLGCARTWRHAPSCFLGLAVAIEWRRRGRSCVVAERGAFLALSRFSFP